jgi:hypothetical protein
MGVTTKKNRPPSKIPTVTIAQQDAIIRSLFPSFKATSIRGDSGGWIGYLQPRVVSPKYRIELCYTIGDVPRMWVRSPPLHPDAPHIWPQDGRLCLYYPEEWLWRRREVIARTVLPLASLWLLYYELWLDTGRWLGPSSHDPHVKAPEPLDAP